MNVSDKQVSAIDPIVVRAAAEETASPEEIFHKALASAGSDPAALYQDNVLNALKTIRRKDEAAYMRLVAHAKGHRTKLDELTAPDGKGREDNIVTILINLAMEMCTFWHDSDGRGVAVIDDGTIRRIYCLDTAGFTGFLRATYFDKAGAGVNDQQIATAVNTLTAYAKYKNEEVKVHLRCAKHEDDYYIDICDDLWRAIRVNKDGWEIVARAPILFIRTRDMRSLPIPAPGGNFNKLWRYLNVSESQRVLILSWLIDCYRPDTPFPILELSGEQGSAKSSSQRRMRDLVDPNKVSLRGRPKTVEDIYVSAGNNHIVSFENLSYLSPEQQDALCTLATGGGFATRQLYTNGDEYVLETKRPVMLNGINPVATQADLIERVINIEALTIPAVERLDEQTIEARWAVDYPIVFSGVLDLFSEALAILPEVELAHKQRMADFQLLGEAVARAMNHQPGYFSEIYCTTVTDGIERSMETYGISNALQVFMANRNNKAWQGSVLELMRELTCIQGSDRSNWPKSPRGLAGQLKRLAPGLRRVGIEITYPPRNRHGRQLCITRSNIE